MKTILVDYSGLCSPDPENHLPETGSGKFVQLRKDDMEYLVFSPTDVTPYHADIVGRFCRDKDINGAYDAEKKRFNIYDPAWTVAGGGKFEIDRVNRRIRFYDNSMAYGKFDSKALGEGILQVEALKDYTVLIV